MNDIRLAEYLPPFLREYKELGAVTKAENPEFVLIWDAAERVLKNEFIETADEFGIARFEKLLGILPSKGETLESRRSRVYSRWFTELPYTLRMFVRKLAVLSGNSGFTVTKDYDHYRVLIGTQLELFGQTSELERLIELMFPCNIRVNVRNTIYCTANCRSAAGGTVIVTERVMLSPDSREALSTGGMATLGGALNNCFFITAAS